MTSGSIADRLHAPGSKRILALDGGGIRGLLTLGFLERIETLLRERHQNPDLLLCDYFDLIGGTSTGAIIAAGLALGLSVTEAQDLYLRLGAAAFTSALPTWVPSWFRHAALLSPTSRFEVRLGAREFGVGGGSEWTTRFKTKPLEDLLKGAYGEEVTLGSERVRTGLCIITKRADTGRTWPLHNNPQGMFFELNRDLPLWKIVRASTAAPIYFRPERIDYGNGVGAFIDGGISMANSPALQLLLLATLDGYRYNWPTGADQLLLVSVGSGIWRRSTRVEQALQHRVWDWATSVPGLLMDDAMRQNQLLLQAMAETPTWWEIDSEVESLGRYRLTPEPLLTYLRYNVELEAETLQALGVKAAANPRRLNALREMSAAEHRHELAAIGKRAGEQQVQLDHFPVAFDLATAGAG